MGGAVGVRETATRNLGALVNVPAVAFLGGEFEHHVLTHL
jgi:hypothetical protein